MCMMMSCLRIVLRYCLFHSTFSLARNLVLCRVILTAMFEYAIEQNKADNKPLESGITGGLDVVGFVLWMFIKL